MDQRQTIRHDGKRPVESCYQCSFQNKEQQCTLMKQSLSDIFGTPLWCPLPSQDEEGKDIVSSFRAIESLRLLGVLRSVISRRFADDEKVLDALMAVECEIGILISSLKRRK